MKPTLKNMWWPFGSKDKDTADLEQELPSGLRLFFKEVNPEAITASSGEGELKDALVERILAKQPQEFDHKFAGYKREELLKKVAAINCAEVQQAVVECYQGWLFLSSNHCTDEIRRTTKCLDLQTRALRQLRYEDCYNKTQCQQMRMTVDILFTKNFGQFGEKYSEEAEKVFTSEVDGMFETLWN